MKEKETETYAVHQVDDALKMKREYQVSFFENCKSNKPITVDLDKIYDAIVGHKYVAKINIVKGLIQQKHYEKANNIKNSMLPAFIVSGVFQGGNEIEHLKKYNNLVGIAYDNMDEAFYQKAFDIVKNIGFTYMAFKNPTGLGLNIIVKVDCTLDMHENAISQVKQYYNVLLGINAESAHGLNVFCLVSDDEDAYRNTASNKYHIENLGKNPEIENQNPLNRIGSMEFDKIHEAKVIAGKSVAEVVSVAQPRFATINTFQMLAEVGGQLIPKRKLFGNFILENSTTLFPAERGIGKSLLVMQLAICIARGDDDYLDEAIELHGNALYVNLELNEDVVAERMNTLIGNQEWVSEFSAYCLTSRNGIKVIYNDIVEYCRNKMPVVIILDNLRTAFVGSDNEKNSQMTEMITLINKLKDITKSAVTIVHHTKKGSSNQITNSDMQSGAGALSDLVDADFFLRRSHVDKDLRILKRVKARNCAEQEGANLIRLNPDTLWFESMAKEVDESQHVIYENTSKQKLVDPNKVSELIRDGFSDLQIAKEIGCDRTTIYRQRMKLS